MNLKPIRIQRKRAKGWKMPENTVSVTRPGKWGNPFRVLWEDGIWCVKDNDGNYYGEPYDNKTEAIDKAIECFSGWIDGKIGIGELNIDELRGKNLACFCKIGEPCHADILLKLANTAEND